MVFVDNGSSMLVAGNHPYMLKIDVMNGAVIQETPTGSRYVMMKTCRWICAATQSGSVELLNPLDLTVVKRWQAQDSPFSSIDAKGNFLVTCGWSKRVNGSLGPDPIAKVFNVWTQNQESPLSFPPGAAFVQIHPRMSTTCVVGSRSGQLQVMEIADPLTSKVLFLPYQLDHFVVSPSGNVWIMVDQGSEIHVWGVPGRLEFVKNSKPTELAEDVVQVDDTSIDDERYVNGD